MPLPGESNFRNSTFFRRSGVAPAGGIHFENFDVSRGSGVAPARGIQFQEFDFSRGSGVAPAGGINFQKFDFSEALGLPLPENPISGVRLSRVSGVETLAKKLRNWDLRPWISSQ